MEKKKIVLLTIVVFLVGIIATAGNYAFWSWTSTVNKNVVFNTAGNLRNYVVYNEGESQFSGELNPGNTYTTGIHSTISIYKTTDVSLLATIHMDVNRIGEAMKKSPALKWVVTEGTSTNVGNILAQGNFVGVNGGDTLTLVPDINVTTTEKFYTIWIWLDSSLNPSSDLSGETLDTNVWTEINQAEGAEDRYEITRATAQSTEPGTWISIPTENQANVYNLNENVSSTGTYYVWFKDALDRQVVSKPVEVSVVDNTAPSCEWGTFNPVQIQNNETSQITLTCTDTESGIRYTITVTGTQNDGTSTLTLDDNLVKNGMGLGNASVTSGSITVANTYTVTYVSGNNNCTLDSTTYAVKTATYGTAYSIANPSCTGYTFTGWTANNGLDTTNARYGSSLRLHAFTEGNR